MLNVITLLVVNRFLIQTPLELHMIDKSGEYWNETNIWCFLKCLESLLVSHNAETPGGLKCFNNSYQAKVVGEVMYTHAGA